MPIEVVSQSLIGILVLSGLAFHERIVDRLASLDTDPDRITADEAE